MSASVASRDFYTILGVQRNASDDEIKKSYNRLAKQYHPDKGKASMNEERFKEISSAYNVLGDSQKRVLYDKYGEEGLREDRTSSAAAEKGRAEGSGASGDGTFDLFDMLSGRTAQQQGPQQQQQQQHQNQQQQQQLNRGRERSENMKLLLPCTLEELYNGALRKMNITRTRICATCTGKGTSNVDAVKRCDRCRGSGSTVQIVQVAPGFVTQMRTVCPNCDGSGQTISKRHRCKSCGGKRVFAAAKELDVYIEAGMRNGQKIVFAAEADERPGVLPGDVIFIVQEKPHDVFERDGLNLRMSSKISLNDALTGVQLTVKTLDNRTLLVKSKPGQIITPGSVKKIRGEGMPTYRNAFSKGSMFISFSVDFPDKLSDKLRDKVATLLPPKRRLDAATTRMKNTEIVELSEVTSFAEEEAVASDDDDDNVTGEGVSCGTQ